MRPAAFLLLILALLAGRSEAAEETLVVATVDRVPMAYVENGRLTGLLVELTEEAFRRIGRKVEIRLLPWPRCLVETKAGSADAVLTIFKTPEREAQFAFAEEEVLHQTESLFMKKDKAFDFDGNLEFFSGS
ncbi:MAG TPA: transporter substrate-binding domain-containing protein, partial [Magnetospirillaceae bacterium]|nr:transporter substrate-binding domain-containing protein [Magnetospirillaceae bacterium]